MKNLLLLFIATFLISCSNNAEKNWDTEIFENLQKLQADQISAEIQVDGQQVFDKRENFNPSLNLSENSCYLAFENSNGEKISLRLDGEGWYKQPIKNVTFKENIPVSEANTGSLSILKKRGNEKEAFILNEGWAEVRQLNQEACIIIIHGMLNSSDKEASSKTINGLIVWKKPKELDANSPHKTYYF